MRTAVAILLLAAGGSRRMRGADKLLEPVDGLPLLRRQAQAALATGVPVVVALPPEAASRRRALDGLTLVRVAVPDAAAGMARSLAAAAEAAPECADLMVLPADMPEIGTPELATMLTAHQRHPGMVLRGAASDGRLGHPVLIPARLRAKLTGLQGDTGAREVLAGEEVVPVHLPAQAALTDLDTPEAWAAWRAAR